MDTVILLHGFGETGGRWQRLVDLVETQTQNPIAWATPTAPAKPQPLAANRTLPAWYDLERQQDGRQWIHVAVTLLYLEAVARVIRMVEDAVAAGTPPERIVVGGASQGGSMALAALLLMRAPRLGGVFAVSGALQAFTTLKSYVEHRGGAQGLAAAHTPVLYMQGGGDYITGSDQMDLTRDYLVRELGFSHWHHRVVPGAGTEFAPEMVAEAAAFIHACLA